MKKICYVTTISLTIKAFFIPQLKYLANNGYDVTVICSPDDDLKEQLGEKIHFIPVTIARGISPKTLLGTISRLKRVFKDENFDIVQYSTPNAAFCASIAARLAKTKIRNYHLMGLRYIGMSGLSRKLFRFLEKLSCKLSTHIECITKSNLELSVSEKLFPAKKATIIWNGSTGGVDLTRFEAEKKSLFRDETRETLGISPNDFVFGFVGRVTRDKGIDELLEAFLGLKKECKLLLVGDKEGIGTLDAELWEKAQSHKNIIILDSVADIEKYYAALDVLVLPSYREGFGMVIIEAAAMGTPAIVTNIPGPTDAIIKDKTALVANVKDAEDLKRKMEVFLDDPELAAKMSKDCVQYVSENFDSRVLCEKIYERKESLFRQI